MATTQELAKKAWYIVTTISMSEARTAENLKRRIASMKMQDFIFRVVVAEVEYDVEAEGDPEPIYDENGVKIGTRVPTITKKKKKNLYPGYIFVEMIMTDQSWYIVRNTPGVTGIVGSSGGGTKPNPIRDEEIESVLKRIGDVDKSMYDRYSVGDKVKIIKGALEGTEGTLLSIDKETGQVLVETIFFGRPTPTELQFDEIEKK